MVDQDELRPFSSWSFVVLKQTNAFFVDSEEALPLSRENGMRASEKKLTAYGKKV